MNSFDIHFYKTENLTPAELAAKRQGAAGVWLPGGRVRAVSGRAACAQYRRTRGLGSKYRLRAACR